MAVLALPEILQRDDVSCGPACAACVLAWFRGEGWRPKPTASALHPTGTDGTDPRTAEAYFRCQGLNVLSGEMSLDDLKQQASLRRPVVCVLTGHYVVAAGVHRNRVHFMDPLEGRLASLPAADYLTRWRDAGRMGEAFRQWGLSVWSS